ncbi:MAG TPA: hypothetical protein VF267_03850 [Gammaproteobacteria bacterium]
MARIAGAIVSIVILAGLFFVGITVFAAVAGLAVVVFAVLALRVWWLRRKLQRGSPPGETRRDRRRTQAGGVTLEGEYEDHSSRDR